jgi:hypothetical protein
LIRSLLMEAGMVATHVRGWVFSILGFAAAGLLAACGGSSSGPPLNVSVAVHPIEAAVVAGSQTQQFSGTVKGDPNNLGVTWAVDGIIGGNASAGRVSSAGLYSPPVSAGNHTVTATSIADATKSASATIGVTDLAGVTTYHYDLARDGANAQEFALTTTSVRATSFGKLFSCAVDGAVYAEPLWLPAVNVGGGTHHVIFVATQHDSVYAFDADASPCQQLWHTNLLDTAHGGVANETPVCWYDVGSGFGDIQPEVGVTGTPVIDPATNLLYVVSKSETGGCSTGNPSVFSQRLHALDATTGFESQTPTNIAASVAGTGDGSSGGVVSFDAQSEAQRSGLALLKNVSVGGAIHDVVYIAWASHEDAFPYHGWILGYNAANVQQQLQVFNANPNGGQGGIWMSGNAPAIDAAGNLYAITGNGTFDADTGGNDYGDSFFRISTNGPLTLTDYFTPFNQANLNAIDGDLGSGGAVLLPDQTVGPPHLLVGGGKQGLIYLVDRDNMGQFLVGSDNVVQEFQADNGSWTTPAFWQNTLYIAGSGDHGNCDNLKSYPFNSSTTGLFNTSASSASTHCFMFPGATPVVSSSGTTNGIVWATEVGCYGTAASPCGGPAVLFAYDANNVLTELWDSTQALGQRDQAGNAVKFTAPTVANGKVYIGTRTEVDVYGLLP